MLAVLSAVTEIIKQHGGNECSTEYFAALVCITKHFLTLCGRGCSTSGCRCGQEVLAHTVEKIYTLNDCVVEGLYLVHRRRDYH